jgi:hypothetical protein
MLYKLPAILINGKQRIFENYPFVAFFQLFCYVLNETSACDEIKILDEVIVGLRDLQSQKSPSARSCSPLPIACALMDTIARVKMQHDNADQDVFNDFDDIRGVSRKSCQYAGSSIFRKSLHFLSTANLHWLVC